MAGVGLIAVSGMHTHMVMTIFMGYYPYSLLKNLHAHTHKLRSEIVNMETCFG